MDAETSALLQLRTIHQGFSTFVVARVRLPDGAVVAREIEDHGDAVALLPFDPERRTALLVRLFRASPLYKGADPMLVEAPAGLVDEGETPENAIRREAAEETGLTLGELEPVATVWSSPGVSAERITLYLSACSFAGRGAGGGRPDEHETIEVLETPLSELGAMLDRGAIVDMKLLALAQALRLRHPDLFR
ncbi:MAG TPA: NUDIX hydrolase [Caulobacteraceae bacterium]|jgi:nudix-type nucleoside diphosphatase (YffH/AdpP family)|nr:NUDIX hydrolase [Caulobacteraceae bacterium]